MDLLEQIKDLIDQGYTLKQIARILNQNYSEIKKRVEVLKCSNIFEEQKEYERLKNKMNENRNNRFKEAGIKNKGKWAPVSNLRGTIIRLIKNEKINVEKGAELLKISLHTMITLLIEENQRTPNPILQDIIKRYKEKELFLSKDYASKSYEFQKEIVMVALTFRVSRENMCRVLQTSLEDIEGVYRQFSNLSQYFYCLEEETVNEKKELKDLAFHKALMYFKTRKVYIQNLEKAQQSNDSLKIEAYNERLKDLRKTIMDASIHELESKTLLEAEEIKLLIDYRIKYSLGLTYICYKFPISHHTVETYEESLILTDDTGYYEEKLGFLNHRYEQVAMSDYNGVKIK